MDAKLFLELLPNDLYLDIHTAASIGCEERVRDIIENFESKPIVDERNCKGWTPLMYAACCANLKVALLLLEEGADTDIKNHEGHTSLILASKCGSSDVVNLLLDNGAKVNHKDLRGWPALFHAVIFGHRSVVQLLIERGASPDIMDDNERITSLMLAAASGHERIVQDLLQLGVNVNIESRSGETARSLAVKNGYMNVKNLIDAFLRSKTRNFGPNIQSNDLASLLRELQLSKYYQVFKSQDIDINTFWLLTDDDLKEIGIQLLGPRKKMCTAISQYHQEDNSKNVKENAASIDNFLTENKRLQHLTEKLKAMVLQEQNTKKAAEKNLADGILKMKNYTERVNSTMNQVVSFLEKQKKEHDRLRNLLLILLRDKNLMSVEKTKVDSIFHLLECIQRHTEIQHKNMTSIQWTSFQK